MCTTERENRADGGYRDELKKDDLHRTWKKVTENRRQLLATKDLEEKRRLIKENHEMMVEMDRRWN